jgi:hypothetical protein
MLRLHRQCHGLLVVKLAFRPQPVEEIEAEFPAKGGLGAQLAPLGEDPAR